MGVVDRRSFEWVVAMITNPDSMTQNDPDARRMLGEYMTLMPNLGLPLEDVQALFEYFRKNSQEGSDE